MKENEEEKVPAKVYKLKRPNSKERKISCISKSIQSFSLKSTPLSYDLSVKQLKGHADEE